MIRFADETMRQQIKKLWYNCFGDANAYVEHFLDHYDISRHLLVFIDGDDPVSMLSMLPMSVVGKSGMKVSGRYIYAVATDPRYRGRGISTKLIEGAHARLKKMGIAFSVLCPASGELFNFYRKRGFEPEFFIGSTVLEAAELPAFAKSFAVSEASTEEFITIRERAFGGQVMFVRWDADSLAYRMAETAMVGGETLVLRTGEGRAVAVCYNKGDAVLIKELALDGMDLQDALGILKCKYNAGEYHLRLPADMGTPFPLERIPNAMSYWYDQEQRRMVRGADDADPYMNLVLD